MVVKSPVSQNITDQLCRDNFHNAVDSTTRLHDQGTFSQIILGKDLPQSIASQCTEVI